MNNLTNLILPYGSYLEIDNKKLDITSLIIKRDDKNLVFNIKLLNKGSLVFECSLYEINIQIKGNKDDIVFVFKNKRKDIMKIFSRNFLTKEQLKKYIDPMII